MDKKNKLTNYDNFHKSTNIQRKIIKDSNFTYRIILKIVNKYLTGFKNILDIGCGAGTLCLYYANKGYNVLGIDISQKAIDSANTSASLLKLINAKFEKKDFPDSIPTGKFDLIIFTEVIEHLENDGLALKKIFSLLNPGGIVVLSTPSRNAPLHKLGLATDFDKKVGHLRRYTIEELSVKSLSCGFKILNTYKTEGVIRNFLFLNPIAGKSIRFIKYFISDIVTFLDNISLQLFGESNIFIILQKPKT